MIKLSCFRENKIKFIGKGVNTHHRNSSDKIIPVNEDISCSEYSQIGYNQERKTIWNQEEKGTKDCGYSRDTNNSCESEKLDKESRETPGKTLTDITMEYTMFVDNNAINNTTKYAANESKETKSNRKIILDKHIKPMSNGRKMSKFSKNFANAPHPTKCNHNYKILSINLTNGFNKLSPMSKEKQTAIQKQLESQKQWIDEHDSELQLHISSAKHALKVPSWNNQEINVKLHAFQQKCQQLSNQNDKRNQYAEQQNEKRIYTLAKEIKDLNKQKEILSTLKYYEQQTIYNRKTPDEIDLPGYAQQHKLHKALPTIIEKVICFRAFFNSKGCTMTNKAFFVCVPLKVSK